MKDFRAFRKKGVTPVIATIILIAGTLVLALVVGAYTFGLFGSNVKTITLASATLYGGSSDNSSTVATSSLGLSLNNPGSQTFITSFTLTGTGLKAPITQWCSTSAANCVAISFATTNDFDNLTAGAVTALTFYPQTPGVDAYSITTGQTFNYVLDFANGQSVSGSLIAQ